jgi:hypothetical protein
MSPFNRYVRLLPPSLQWVPWPLLAEALRFPTFTGTYGVVRLLDHPSAHPSVDPWLRVPFDPVRRRSSWCER